MDKAKTSFQNTFKLMCVISVILMMLMSISCSSDNSGQPDDFTRAVANVSSSATGLNILSYTTGQQATIKKDRSEFSSIIDYLEKSTVTRSQARYVENDGKMVEVGIPYAIAFILEFTFSGDSAVVFDFGIDQVWFNTADMIYSASVDATMYDFLDQLVNK
jgi:hypothetical protein